MVETRTVVVCTECQAHWYQDCEPAKYNDPDHDHQLFEMHQHHSVVVLPNGYRITAVSFDAGDPYGRVRLPDYGLYLDRRWKPPWMHGHLDWPDFGVPTDVVQMTAALRSLLERADGGQVVEIGCVGGHGRTGTALACLAILSGRPADEAVAWVRDHYCSEAVETTEQEEFVVTFEGGGRRRS
jgi:hypothetical protein